MMAVSLLSIALKLVAARRGELVCFVQTFEATNFEPTVGVGAGAEAFIVASEGCIAEVYKRSGGARRQKLPFMMFMMTLSILAIDIISFRIRKFEQRVLRFHQMIIKRGVLTSGDHHQDVDDILNPMESPIFKEAIKALAKDRSRNELCNELKRSNILYYTFIAKNIFKVVLVAVYLFFEGFIWKFEVGVNPVGTCTHDHSKAIRENQEATCQEKFSTMFGIFIIIYVLLLMIYAVCCGGCLLFLVTSRPVTGFVSKVNRYQDGGNTGTLISRKRTTVMETEEGRLDDVVISTGFDFLFLFDLLAHNYGLEQALKSMTYVDKDFYKLMAPTVTVKDNDVGSHHITVEWTQTQMESLLEEHESDFKICSLRECKRSKVVRINSYIVTVIQMDGKNQTILDIIKVHPMDARIYDHGSGKYRLKLDNLSGGENKYSITVSIAMGETMMKGTSLMKYLCPHDPGLPLDGKLCTDVTTNGAQLKWIAPFGGFDRYILTAESEDGVIRKVVNQKDNSFALLNLEPCTKYVVKVFSVTGMKPAEEVRCMNPIEGTFLTKPLKPLNIIVSNVTKTTCTIYWGIKTPQKRPLKEKIIATRCAMKFIVEVSIHSEDKNDKNKTEKKDNKDNNCDSKKKDGKNNEKDSEKLSKDSKKLEVIVHSCTPVCMSKGCMYAAEIKDLTPSTNYDVSLTLLGLLSEEEKEWIKSDMATAQFSTD